jgi:DnaJ-class molecular chaperone
MKHVLVAVDEKMSKRKKDLGKFFTWDRLLRLGIEAAESAVKEGREKAESAVNGKICNTCKGNGEWVDVESREITICPDCNGTGILSKTCHTLKVNSKWEA